MALPTTRQETHGPQSPIKGTTIDAIQDQIIGHKKPSLVRSFFPTFLKTPLAFTTLSISISDAYWQSGGAGQDNFAIPFVEAGDRITSIKFNVFGDGVVDCTFTAWLVGVNSALTKLASLQDVNRAAAWGVFDLATDNVTPWANRTMLAGESLIITAAPNAANYRLGNCRVTYDRL